MGGKAGADDPLVFADFIKELDHIRHALKETQRILTRSTKEQVEFRVVRLRRDSPTEVVIEGFAVGDAPQIAENLVTGFLDAVDDIQQRRQVPRGFDGRALSAYQAMAEMIGQKMSSIDAAGNGRSIGMSRTLHQNVAILLGEKRYSVGSMTGKLEQINIHKGQNVFTIYPIAGPVTGVRCHFGKGLLDRAANAVNHFVEVRGRFTYNPIDPHPEEILVKDMSVHEKPEMAVRIQDLEGIAPGATGDKSSEDFVRELRDEW
jgi:hypothetical protein